MHCGISGYEYDLISNGAYKPVIYVSWYEARAYCKFVYGANGDLPTEAQWERAAKGTTSGSYQYPWGTTSPTCTLANYSGCTGATDDVGSHLTGVTGWPGNPGLHDMAGNVWEWTQTWFEDAGAGYEVYYGAGWSNGVNPTKVEKGSSTARVERGGDWTNNATLLQSAYRSSYSPVPYFRSYYLGFRCSVFP